MSPLTTRDVPTRASPEIGRLAQAGPARIAARVLRDVPGAGPGSIEPGNAATVPVLHLRVHGRPKPTEREAGELGAAYRQVEGGVGRLIERLDPFAVFVEPGILAAARVAVVLVHRGHERTRGQPQPRLHLRDGVEPVYQRLLEELVWRISEDLRVEDQVADAFRLLDEKSGGPPVIGILGHEATSLRVDQDPFQHVGGRIERRGEKRPVETDRLASRRDAETPSRIPDPSSLLVPCFIRSRGIQASSRSNIRSFMM